MKITDVLSDLIQLIRRFIDLPLFCINSNPMFMLALSWLHSKLVNKSRMQPELRTYTLAITKTRTRRGLTFTDWFRTRPHSTTFTRSFNNLAGVALITRVEDPSALVVVAMYRTDCWVGHLGRRGTLLWRWRRKGRDQITVGREGVGAGRAAHRRHDRDMRGDALP